MKPKTSRAIYLLILVIFISVGVYVILKELNSNITFFYTPTEISQLSELPKTSIRIGGVVKPGSIKKTDKNLSFVLTDCEHEINIIYNGTASPLFREKQGIVALGMLTNFHLFQAVTLLTKHDENYKPKTMHEPKDTRQNFCQFSQNQIK